MVLKSVIPAYNEGMNDNKLFLFNIFGVLFLTVLVLYLVLSMGLSLHVNSLKAKTMLDSIADTVIEDLLSKSGVSSKTSNFVKLSNLSLSFPSLKSLVVTDNSGKAIYVFSRNPRAVTPSDGQDSFNQKVDSFKDTSLSTFTSYNGKTFNIKTVFTVLHGSQFVSLLKYSVIASLVFIIISLFFLIAARTPVKAVLTDNSTGYSNKGGKTAFISRISNELKRAASFDQDMTLAIIKVPDEIIASGRHSFEKLLNETFPYSDLIFNYAPSLYGLIIPNTDIDKGITAVRDFDQNTATRFTILYGLSSRNGRLVEGEVLFREASAAIKKAEKEKDANIIGFRPDPAKYREFLTKKG